ncbi:uncharacterized protein LOC129289194 [Prosopis cineraria]|uniref:uncharacterized protein LOC129289194 n=1 Tax=Prosopis cineraria TaxID=364024 RepID=UPI0024101906|nr:uncharacterized protein LOC129289194 [Prosopis cineraria]
MPSLAEFNALKDEVDILHQLVGVLLTSQGKTSTPVDISSNSKRDSCTIAQPSHLNLPEFLANSPDRRVFAIGIMYNLPGGTIHNVPIPLGHVRVCLKVSLDDNYQLPIPTEDVMIVGDALGTFVAWPTALTRPIFNKDKSKEKYFPSKQLTGHESKIIAPPLLQKMEPQLSHKFLTSLRAYTDMQRSIHDFIAVDVPFEHGMYDRDHTNHITLEVVDEVIHRGMISTTVMDFYLRFLYHTLVVPRNLTMIFACICPYDIVAFRDIRNSDHEDQAKRDYWMLIALDPAEEKYEKLAIYYLCSAGGQPDSVDCGYCVMRFIRDIITHAKTSIPTKYYDDAYCEEFGDAHINEVVEEWGIA